MLSNAKISFWQLSGTGLRYLLAGLFLWAGITKLCDPKSFARSVDAFGLVPDGLLIVVAIGLPLLEVLAAVALVLRWSFGLPLMAGLLLLFIGVLWYGVLSGLDVDCGCFSVVEQEAHTSLQQVFWRDWLLLVALVCVPVAERQYRSARSGRDGHNLLNEGEQHEVL